MERSHPQNHSLDEIRLDAVHIAPDGKQVITLDKFLCMFLKHPEHKAEAMRLNDTNILTVLGLPYVGQAEAKKAIKWLRANGYRSV